MAAISESKRKALIAKGAKYYDKWGDLKGPVELSYDSEQDNPEFAKRFRDEMIADTTKGDWEGDTPEEKRDRIYLSAGAMGRRKYDLPNGGKMEVVSPLYLNEAIKVAERGREAERSLRGISKDPNESELVQQYRKNWDKEDTANRSKYENFLATKGKPVDPFTGGSLVQQERDARLAAEIDRNKVGRINRYARMAERSGQPVMAKEFRDKVAKEFDDNPNKEDRIRRYEGIIRANRQRAVQVAANPLT